MTRIIPESEFIINPDGSVFHLHLKPEQISDKIVMMGDPERVTIAASLFDSIECEVQNREFRTITGKYKGKRITALSHGIGTVSYTHLCDLATLDLLMSCGEVISACVLADSLVQQGIDAVALNSLQAGIVTDGVFGSADIFDIDTKRIKMELHENKVVVVTGFQGVTVRNDITTLGRGGSDTSAVVIGGFMDAESVHIFTDVPGVAVIDPRLVPKAKYMKEIDLSLIHIFSNNAKLIGSLSPRKGKTGQDIKEKPDVIIDFSNTANVDFLIEYAIKNKSALLIGTTGFNDDDKIKIREAGKHVPVMLLSLIHI